MNIVFTNLHTVPKIVEIHSYLLHVGRKVHYFLFGLFLNSKRQ